MAVYHQVYDLTCVCGSLCAWWEVVTAHQAKTRFMTMHAVTCRLTAKYVISSITQHYTYKHGTTFTFFNAKGK